MTIAALSPKASTVTSICKAARYLDKNVESVLRWMYVDFEFVF